MNVINAVVQFEHDLLIERTLSGLARAKASGKPLGRPAALSKDQQAEVKEKRRNNFNHRTTLQDQQTDNHARQRSRIILCRITYLL